MAEPFDSCIGYWKLEDETAEIGPDFAITGTPVYSACKFNNGFDNTTTGNFLKATLTGAYLTQKGCVEMWVNTPYSVSNGDPSDGDIHGILNIGRQTDPLAIPSHFMFLNGVIGQLTWQVSTTAEAVQTKNFVIGIDWAANTDTHLLFVWDGSLGANNLKIYINGSLGAQTGCSFSDQSLAGRFLWPGYGQEDWLRPFDGIIDNLKIYNQADAIVSAIIANKDNEDWPVTTRPRIRVN